MTKFFLLGLFLCSQVCLAQTKPDSSLPVSSEILVPVKPLNVDTVLLDKISRPTFGEIPVVPFAKKKPLKATLVTPGLLIGFGFLTMDNPEFLESNEAVQEGITRNYPGFRTKIDNYTQFAPLAAVYGLNLAGVKGKNNLVNLSILYALSSFINGTISKNLKTLTQQQRPDFPSFDAFPSRHTSTAFSNAELMRLEYKDKSAWYGVAGYSFAVATGSMRMLNNRHWLSDVVAGAGVGILSTRLAYLLYPWLQQKIKLVYARKNKMMVAPMYQQGSFGLSLGLPLN